jgi:hypothetical protein
MDEEYRDGVEPVPTGCRRPPRLEANGFGSSMSSNSPRRDQRRRLLVAWNRSATPSPSGAASGGKQAAGYSPEAHPERLPGPALLLPTGLGGLALAAGFVLVPVAGLTAIGAWETIAGRPLLTPDISSGRFAATIAAATACVDPQAVSSLQAWLAQMWLAVAAGTALVVRLMRRHRRDDYQGRYRAWSWLAGLLLLTACAGVVPVGSLVGAVVTDATGIAFGPAGIGWWFALATVAFTPVVLWAVLPLHERRGTAVWMGLALAAWAASAAWSWQAATAASSLLAFGIRAAWTGGAALMAMALFTAARSVIREVRGLVSRDSAAQAKPTRSPQSQAAEPARTAVAPPQEPPDADDDSATDAIDYTDGSEAEQRFLSKAERKRLKKLARMREAAA